MTTLLECALAVLCAYALYVATVSARAGGRPEHFLDGGLTIPSWACIFAGMGLAFAGIGLPNHLLLTALYGLQYSHVAIGLILTALVAALVHKRLWLAARITGLRTLGDLLGDYYGSVSIRIYLLLMLGLFAVPFAADALAQSGALLSSATRGELPAELAVWATAFFLFLFSVIGGWRGVVYVVAAEALLVLVLLAFTGGFAGLTFDGFVFLNGGIATQSGILGDRIPGVVQFTAGLGKGVPAGGIWTTVAILSFAIALTGIVLSPAFALLGISSDTRTGLAFQQVWMISGLATGALLLIGPLLAAEIAAPGNAASPLAGLADRLGGIDQLAGVAFLLMLLASLQIGIAFFAMAGAGIGTIELIARYMLPGLTGSGQRLGSRIVLAGIYVTIAALAAYAPLIAAIVSPLTLSLSAQLLPACLGLCSWRWISRQGVITGLIIGLILVLFTEPAGLIAFEGLFIPLPWGRWPLTVHSAAWGLVFNLAFCILVSLFTRGGLEREQRDRLHDEFRAHHRWRLGGRALKAAKWSLTLIWAFLALGPAAILGNTLFSPKAFGSGPTGSGVPSLIAWQIVAWFAGVFAVWWLAYQSRLSVIEAVPRRILALGPGHDPLQRRSAPGWIARAIHRLAGRSVPEDRRPGRHASAGR